MVLLVDKTAVTGSMAVRAALLGVKVVNREFMLVNIARFMICSQLWDHRLIRSPL